MLTEYFAMARLAGRVPRRGRREVHRRCRPGRVRGPDGPRGRRRAGGPRRAPDRGRGGPPPRPGWCAGSAPRRHQHRRGPGPPRRQPGLRRAVPRRRRDQHRVAHPVGRARDGRRRRPADVRGHARDLRLRRAPAGHPQGQGGAGPGLPCARAASPPRGRPHPHARHAVRGAGDRPRAARGPVRQDRRRRAQRSSSRSSASPGSARAGSSRELRAHATRGRARDVARRAAACRTARGSRSGPSASSSRRTPGSSSRTRPDVVIAKLEAVLPDDAERAWMRERLLPLLGIGASTARRSRGAVHGVAPVPGAPRRGSPHRPRVRGPPLGRRGAARLPRARRGPGGGRPAADRRDRAAGALRAPPGLRVAPPQREPHQPRAPCRPTRSSASSRRSSRAPASDRARAPDPGAGGGQPALRRGVRPAAAGPRRARRPRRRRSTGDDDVPFPDSVHAADRGPSRHPAGGAEVDCSPTPRSWGRCSGRAPWRRWASATSSRSPTRSGELARKELVQPVRRSSIAGEAEYTFSHILTRDVAYSQLPRAARAARHAAAARWIEAIAPDRLEDLADVLAYHYETALASARAAGDATQAAELEAPALRFLTLAGERALGLDTAAAVATLERALALTSPGDPRRVRTLTRYGQALFEAARYAEAVRALEEAIPAAQTIGDVVATAEAMTLLGRVVLPVRRPPDADARPRGPRARRAARPFRRPRRGAHRGRRRQCDVERVRDRDHVRRAGPGPRGCAWAPSPRSGARLPRPRAHGARRRRWAGGLPRSHPAGNGRRPGARSRAAPPQFRVPPPVLRGAVGFVCRPPARGTRTRRPAGSTSRSSSSTSSACPPSSTSANTTRRSPSRTAGPAPRGERRRREPPRGPAEPGADRGAPGAHRADRAVA